MVSREQDAFDKLPPLEKRAHLEALAARGQKIQEAWNRRRSQPPPGKPPQQRGIGPMDQAQARANVAARKAAQQEYIQKLRAEQEEKARAAEREAEIQAKMKQYEAELRAQAQPPRTGG